MSRLPIRVRLAAAFAAAMAVVLAGTGVFLYERLGADLARSLDQDLRLRAQDLGALVRDRNGSLAAAARSRLVERGESFAQLVDGRDRVIDASSPLSRPLLSARDLGTARQRELFFDRPRVPGLDEPARLLAVPVTRGRRSLVLVVGTTRENRAEALRSLRTELLIAGPLALLLATGAGYVLAGGGLRSVEAMRRRAAAITGERSGARLPIPRSGDELERLATTLNEMLARLEQTLERERSFVADAGHELRTPLSLLRAELDFALHHAESEEELRRAVLAASEETDRLVQLAGDLLLIASADGDKVDLRREQISAHELLTSVGNRFAWRAQEAGRTLTLDAPAGLELEGDRLRLEQALGNLVENALRHGDGAVVLEARVLEDAVELHVRDEGRGFPPGFLDSAFERFSRPSGSRSGGGAGLGLAIVAAIARAHGGRANALNDSKGGADVWIATSGGRPS